MTSKIKRILKKIIHYTIEDDYRVYRFLDTPLKLKKSLTAEFLSKYGNLRVVPDKIVIDNYMGSGYGCNSKYVVEELIRAGIPCELVWVVKDLNKAKGGIPQKVRLVEYLSEEAMYEYATAGIWLCNYHLIAYFNRGLVKKQEQTYIQMWHGSFGIKKIENDCDRLTQSGSWTYLAKKNAGCTDYWISNSDFETEVYQRAFWGAGQILEFGHPRNDVFFRNEVSGLRIKVELALEIKQQDRLFLYVPTFRETGSSGAMQLDISAVKKGLEERFGSEWVIAVRFHPRMDMQEREAFLKKWDGVLDVSGYPDIQELLLRADAAATDYSSCIFDYMLQKKPGFLFVPDREEYMEERGFYYSLEQTPFFIAESNQQMLDGLRSFREELYQERVDSFLREKGSKEDGHASERVAGLIRQIIERKRTDA